MDARQKIQGFTLLEIVIVIMVIAILAVMPFAQWPQKAINLDAQAQQVADDIRYAQSLAMNKAQRFRWVENSTTSYSVTDSTGSAILLPSGQSSVTLNSGISFGTLTNLPNNLVAFDSRARPYTDSTSPGTLLAANATIPLTDGAGHTKTITIAPQTGAVTIS